MEYSNQVLLYYLIPSNPMFLFQLSELPVGKLSSVSVSETSSSLSFEVSSSSSSSSLVVSPFRRRCSRSSIASRSRKVGLRGVFKNDRGLGACFVWTTAVFVVLVLDGCSCRSTVTRMSRNAWAVLLTARSSPMSAYTHLPPLVLCSKKRPFSLTNETTFLTIETLQPLGAALYSS